MATSDQSSDLIREFALRFEHHGKNIYGNVNSANASPLYAYISLKVAEDPIILRLLEGVDLTTTVTNLFFGAVHFLLMENSANPLAEFYPDLAHTPRSIEDVYPYFRAFCLENETEINHIITTRFVQTNEVGRCAGLLPVFNLIAERVGDKPLALVEIGASAGLHLLWDQYAYQYGDAGDAGTSHSPVHIVSAVRGEHIPPLHRKLAKVDFRVGIDLNPIDVHSEIETRWVKALIWPEHRDRRQLLEAALSVARQYSIEIVKGDAGKILPDVLSRVPSDCILCIHHSYTLNQMPTLNREQILTAISMFSRERDLYRISQEWYDGQDKPHIELHSYRQGTLSSELLAYGESHGRWIEWLQPNNS